MELVGSVSFSFVLLERRSRSLGLRHVATRRRSEGGSRVVKHDASCQTYSPSAGSDRSSLNTIYRDVLLSVTPWYCSRAAVRTQRLTMTRPLSVTILLTGVQGPFSGSCPAVTICTTCSNINELCIVLRVCLCVFVWI